MVTTFLKGAIDSPGERILAASGTCASATMCTLQMSRGGPRPPRNDRVSDDHVVRDMWVECEQGWGNEHNHSPTLAMRHKGAPSAPSGEQVQELIEVLRCDASLLQQHDVSALSRVLQIPHLGPMPCGTGDVRGVSAEKRGSVPGHRDEFRMHFIGETPKSVRG